MKTVAISHEASFHLSAVSSTWRCTERYIYTVCPFGYSGEKCNLRDLKYGAIELCLKPCYLFGGTACRGLPSSLPLSSSSSSGFLVISLQTMTSLHRFVAIEWRTEFLANLISRSAAQGSKRGTIALWESIDFACRRFQLQKFPFSPS